MRFLILVFWGALCALNALVFDEAKLLNDSVKIELDNMSSELEARTGVKTFLLTHQNNEHLPLGELAKMYLKNVEQGDEYAVLVLVPKRTGEKSGQVDLFLSDPELCERDEVLSPLPSVGTILPILVANKAEDIYNAALFNGFADVIDKIAAKKGVALASSIGSDNRTTINIIRLFVYGFLIIAFGIFAYKSIRNARAKNK